MKSIYSDLIKRTLSIILYKGEEYKQKRRLRSMTDTELVLEIGKSDSDFKVKLIVAELDRRISK